MQQQPKGCFSSFNPVASRRPNSNCRATDRRDVTRFNKVVVLLLVVAIGCTKKVANQPPTPPPAVNTTSATEVDSVEAAVIPEEAATANEDVAEDQVATDENSEDSDEVEAEASPESDEVASDTADAEESVEQVAEADPPPSERFLLLTRDGPLVVDVILQINNEPHALALNQLIDQVMDQLDEGESGQIEWTAAVEHPAFAYGQYGNLAPEDDEQMTQLIEMYDTNRNSLVDRTELPRFLTRNVAGSRSFSLRSSNEFRGDNRTRSPVRRLLDIDRNGAITTEEMAAAPSRLFDRDADDDEILVLTDIKDTVEQMQPQMSNQRRVNAPDTAISIHDRTRWGYVSYALQETYAYGDRVGADDIPLTPELVELLDANNNSLIDNNEVSKLAEVPAHLVLQIDFFDASQVDRSANPTIEIVSATESLQSVLDKARQYSTRISFELPGADVEFFVNEDPSFANSTQVLQNQFDMLDADNNEYIDADEYSGQVLGFDLPFAALDADSNEMIQLDELTAIIEQRQSVTRAQIRARAADREDALFTALDTNGDGRLTAREIYGTPQVLQQLDRNKDGKLQSHEIPGTMAVGFVRGDSQQDNTLLVMPAIAQRNDDEDLPKWFAGMDSNGDGDISPREFLGSREKFKQLDTDSDGFVSSEEAKQVGA